jgi:hypothetical protein
MCGLATVTGFGGRGGVAGGQRGHSRVELGQRYYLIDQPEAQRFGCLYFFGQRSQLKGFERTDEARQEKLPWR